MLLSKALKM
jgi:DNA repair exonuclease SbcCD ATPase subunit